MIFLTKMNQKLKRKQQYGIQFVGSSASGKTTFLASFWHEYKSIFENKTTDNELDIEWKKIALEPNDDSKSDFDKFEECFKNGKPVGKTSGDTIKYSLIHKWGKKVSVEMAIYDIMGEKFDFSNKIYDQSQFGYCDGFILLVDLNPETGNAGEVSVINFINFFKHINQYNTNKKSNIPLAVILMKADLFKKEIGLAKIKTEFNMRCDSDKTYEEFQSEFCCNFLCKQGYKNLVDNIEVNFSNIRYFPVSAIGHAIEDNSQEAYQPWGVLEPMFWLMSDKRCPLHSLVQTIRDTDGGK